MSFTIFTLRLDLFTFGQHDVYQLATGAYPVNAHSSPISSTSRFTPPCSNTPASHTGESHLVTRFLASIFLYISSPLNDAFAVISRTRPCGIGTHLCCPVIHPWRFCLMCFIFITHRFQHFYCLRIGDDIILHWLVWRYGKSM